MYKWSARSHPSLECPYRIVANLTQARLDTLSQCYSRWIWIAFRCHWMSMCFPEIALFDLCFSPSTGELESVTGDHILRPKIRLDSFDVAVQKYSNV